MTIAKVFSRSMALLLILFGCKTPQLDLQNNTERLIKFGSGGGITGARQLFYLTNKGHLFQHNEKSDTYEFMKKVSSKEMKEFYAYIDELEFENIRFNKPGNYYKFLAVSQKGNMNKVVWSMPSDELPEGLIDFYKSLRKLLQND